MPDLILVPNGAGDATGLSPFPGAPNWGNVDEYPAPDDDTSYNDGDGYDLYALTDHTTETEPITQIEVFFRSRVSGGINQNHYPKIKTGGTEYSGSNKSTGAWSTGSTVWAVNPKTTVAWTWADIDALQAGAYVTGAGANDGRLTQVYVVVSYTVASFDIDDAGAIASAEAFENDHSITVDIDGAGAIASGEAFQNDHALTLDIDGAGAIASAEAFEVDHTVISVYEISDAGGIASAEAFENDHAVAATVYVIGDAGDIGSGEAFENDHVITASAYVLPEPTIRGTGVRRRMRLVDFWKRARWAYPRPEPKPEEEPVSVEDLIEAENIEVLAWLLLDLDI
jgi:hypothetical protein